jgi:hypothetical protein
MKISHSLITLDVIGYSATKPSDQSSLEQAPKPSNVNSNEDDAFCHFSLTRARCWNATCVREDGPAFPLELKKSLFRYRTANLNVVIVKPRAHSNRRT